MLGKRKNTRDGRPLDTGKPTRRPPNKYAAATAMLSSATPLFLGYDLAVVYCTAVMAQGDLRLLACVIALSMILGAIVAAGAQRLIGDRRAVLLSAAVLCAGALARSLAAGFAAFTAGVFVNGVGMGLALMVVPAYAAELSLTSARGVVASHPDGFVYLGCILGSLCFSMGFSKLPAHVAWRVTVASGTAIPALLSAAVLVMPESPRWLVALDRESEARRVLSRTSATLEEAELRLLEIKGESGKQHDGDDEAPIAVTATRGRWREEFGTLRGLLTRPTEPLRRAVLTALVAKVFQQASGIGSIVQYVQRAFRDVGASSGAQMPRALAVFGFVVVMPFPMLLVLVELCWLLVRALASRFRRRAPSHTPRPSHVGMTRRQEQKKWVRGLSATMLLSLMALTATLRAENKEVSSMASAGAEAVEPKKKSNIMYAFICSILASMASIILGYGTRFTSCKSSFFYLHGSPHLYYVHC
ncbi:Polyol transporter 5 [Dichanthelium oligosanthes]|uniref:Polyol transporter 5 n=1 Tax=Dichanthelium oligosanthes TaxID=888268 RepID=A0A1E5VEW6_9POAL|nr:Polyol transporter 5 [Dichanthelium oligosanthes]